VLATFLIRVNLGGIEDRKGAFSGDHTAVPVGAGHGDPECALPKPGADKSRRAIAGQGDRWFFLDGCLIHDCIPQEQTIAFASIVGPALLDVTGPRRRNRYPLVLEQEKRLGQNPASNRVILPRIIWRTAVKRDASSHLSQ